MLKAVDTELSVPSLCDYMTTLRRSLRAKNRSPRTMEAYEAHVRYFVEWLTEQGYPTTAAAITKRHVEEYIDHQLTTLAAATAALRFRSLKAFFNWLVREEEITKSPLAGMAAPHVPDVPPPVIRAADIAELFKACSGRSFADRRDSALMRLLYDTGIRIAELANLRVGDIDEDRDLAFVSKTKGGNPRVCPYGDETGIALGRYLRLRKSHPRAGSESLWLGPKGPLTASGIHQMLKRRCRETFGHSDLHAHLFRHTFAHEFMMDGGSTGDLKNLVGWSSEFMANRYGRAAAAERAMEGYRRRGAPGDRLKEKTEQTKTRR